MRWAEGEARQNLRRREGLLKGGALNVQRLLGLMSGDRWGTKFMNVRDVCPSFISTNCSWTRKLTIVKLMIHTIPLFQV
jgi:hypothetical protein